MFFYVLDKVLDSGVKNIKLLLVDGFSLLNYFDIGEVDLMYFNFSDLWFKKKYEKCWLIYKIFLDIYKDIFFE